MIAAIYARKSTEQNGIADDQKSVARQVEHATAYAERKGWTVDDRYIFIDDGISGAEFANRPGYMRVLNALKPRAPFQVLIVSELSRLGREQLETSYALKQLSQAGVKVVSYLEDKEVLLDTPVDKFLMSAVSFAAEIEREKARQRTYDAMLRKARAGHVTGGRVFGYENVRTDAGHVERVINEAEAAVVRKIFELTTRGHGRISIAKLLNAKGAPAPRSQQGRPCAWAPTSIREVLYRELYRGVIVWNKTRKRDTWGKLKQTDRPDQEWVRVEVPRLRVVSDELWQATQARLSQARDSYLRVNGGRLWGRPVNGVASKYLLTGLSRCRTCGGNFEVQSRSHGRERAHFYACASYYRRGPAVCANGLVMPLDKMEGAVIDAFEPLLTNVFVETTVRKVLTRAVPAAPALDEERTKILAQLADIKRELANLIEGLARTGASRSVTTAIKHREARQAHLERELATLERREHVSHVEVQRLEGLARQKVGEWRGVLRKHAPQARQILSKLLRDRLVFVPERRHGRLGYRFHGEGTIIKLLSGVVPELASVHTGGSGVPNG